MSSALIIVLVTKSQVLLSRLWFVTSVPNGREYHFSFGDKRKWSDFYLPPYSGTPCLLLLLWIQGTPDSEAPPYPPALFYFLHSTCRCVNQFTSSGLACFCLPILPGQHDHPEGRLSLGRPFSRPSLIPELGLVGNI